MEFEVEANPSRGKIKWTRICFATVVSTALLILLFRRYQAPDVIASLRSAVVSGWILLALCISGTFNIFLFTEEWRLILHALKHRVRYRVLLYTHLASDIIPLRGGELLKAWYLSKRHHLPLTASGEAIVLHMAFNLGALILLGLTGFIGRLTGSLWIGIACACSVMIIFLITAATSGRFLLRILPENTQDTGSLREKLLDLVKSISGIRTGRLIVIVLYSLFFQFSEIISVALVFKALAIDVEFVEILVYVPAISFVANLPISLSGLGIRESSLILAFHDSVHASSEELLAVGLIYSIIESILPQILGLPLTTHLFVTFPNKRGARSTT